MSTVGECILTKSGAFINLSDIYGIKNLCKEFTLTFNNKIAVQILECYLLQKDKNRILLPRFGALSCITKNKFGMGKLVIDNQLSDGQDIFLKWEGLLNSNQQKIVDHLIENIYNNENVESGLAGCILQDKPGRGKSYTSLYLVSVFNKKTLIILHSSAMIEDWTRAIKLCYPKCKIGEYHSKKKCDGEIVMMLSKSACGTDIILGDTKLKAMEYFSTFGYVILDECHTYGTENYFKKMFRKIQMRRMIGLSATPDNNQKGFENIYKWNIGCVFDANVFYEEEDQKFDVVINRIEYYSDEKIPTIKSKIGMIDCSATINKICEDVKRKNMIIDMIEECIARNDNTYVFADRTSYLFELEQILRTRLKESKISEDRVETYQLCNDEDFLRITGGASVEEFKKTSIAKVIFTTYKYMGTGKSIVKMNAMIMTTPYRNNMEQYIGRITRLSSDISIQRVVYDIVDMKCSLSSQWTTRHKYYKSQSYQIIYRKKGNIPQRQRKSKNIRNIEDDQI